jgi:DNA primase
MYQVQDTTRSSSDSEFSFETRSSDEDFGWEIEPDTIKITNKEVSALNQSISILDFLNSFGVKCEEFYSPSGWSHKALCPFPDHKERTPSFHINPEENRFWCFGCHRGGGPVNFLAFYKNINIYEAADELLKNSNFDFSDIIVNKLISEEVLYNEILPFSEKINYMFKIFKDEKSFKFINNICYSLDIFLEKNISKKSLNLDDIKARVSILIEKLNKYEQDINNR